MHFYQKFISAGLFLVLSACGGGGGNASAPIGSGSTPSTAGKTVDTRLSAVLQDSSGASIQSIPVNGVGQVVVSLTDASGIAVANQTVKIIENGTSLVGYPSGTSATTDSKGVAIIKVSRKSEFKYGTSSLTLQFDAPTGCSTVGGNNCFVSSTTVATLRSSPPVLKLDLLDASGSVTTTISSSGNTTLRASLKYEDGTVVSQKRVDVAGDLTKVSFPEGSSGLTNSGIALVKISRASQSVSGAGTLTASATLSGSDSEGVLDTTVVTGSLDYILGAAVGADKLTLVNLDVGSTTLAAYGTRQISVQANVGALPSPSPVSITFAANCGQVLPAIATTNSVGVAVVSYTATDISGTTPSTRGCSGRNVEISASAVGADLVKKTFTVSAAPATNVAFVVPADPTKLRIYLEGSGGPTLANLQFQLTDAQGAPIGSQNLLLTLKTTNGGIPKATFGNKGNTAPITLTTDSSGKVTVPVYSGTVPTTVTVNAAVVADPGIQTDSLLLAIASGRPTQSGVSMSLSKASIRGANFDGEEATVTVALSDRQGNPVPDGTAINFVTEGGVMIPPVCTTGGVPGDSRCSVKIRTQEPRGSNGRVSILAYAAGEEDFVDANFNNVYDCGESFTDLGTAFRDNSAMSGGVPSGASYTAGSFAVPRSSSPSACGTGVTPFPSSGDGVWGVADVRQQAVIVFSTGTAKFSGWSRTKRVISGDIGDWNDGTELTTSISVLISDSLGNSLPTDTSIAAEVIDQTRLNPVKGKDTDVQKTIGTCTLVATSTDLVPFTLDPLLLTINLKDCVVGDQVKLILRGYAGATSRMEYTVTIGTDPLL